MLTITATHLDDAVMHLFALHPEHAHHELPAAQVLTWWTPDPWVWCALAGVAALYARGVAVLWARAGRGHGIRPWEAGAFAAGLAVLVIALVSPLDRLSDVSFAAHMTQHELLLVMAPPLFVFGRSLVGCYWGLPLALRESVGRALQARAVRVGWRWLTAPFLALLVHGAAVWVWHIPRLFEATMHDEWVHGAEHALFFTTACLFFWSLVHGGYGRVGYGAAVVYVFATSMHTGLLGALLTFAPSPWYATYVERAPAWGFDAVEDQQVAGLIMWIPASIVLAVLALALFAAWIGESEQSAVSRATLTGRSAARDVS